MKQCSIIDTTNFPIVIVKMTESDLTNEQFDEHLERMYQLYKDSDEKFVIIFDLSIAKYMNSSLRIKQGQWLEKNKDLIKQKLKGAIYCSPTVISKLILQCIFAVQQPDWNNAVVANLNEAIRKANTMLATV